MNDFFEKIRDKKIANIPILYLLLALAAVGLYMAFRMQSTSDTTDVVDETADPTEGDYAGDEPLDSQPIFFANPTPVTSTDTGDGGDSGTETNDEWGTKAVNWLVADGASPQTASNAIAKYLAGEILSMQEGNLRDKAIKQFGVPPEGLITTKTQGYQGPFSSQGVPPCVHVVRGKSDDSAVELAKGYYGITSGDAVKMIRAANSTIKEPYRVGTRITVPAYRQAKYYKATKQAHTLAAIAAKNGVSVGAVQALNPGMTFPVAVGTRVRVK